MPIDLNRLVLQIAKISRHHKYTWRQNCENNNRKKVGFQYHFNLIHVHVCDVHVCAQLIFYGIFHNSFVYFFSIKMKAAVVGLLALCCMVGMALGQVGFFPGSAPSAGAGFGSGGLIMLLLLFVLFSTLFGNQSSATGSTTLVYGNFSATG